MEQNLSSFDLCSDMSLNSRLKDVVYDLNEELDKITKSIKAATLVREDCYLDLMKAQDKEVEGFAPEETIKNGTYTLDSLDRF